MALLFEVKLIFLLHSIQLHCMVTVKLTDVSDWRSNSVVGKFVLTETLELPWLLCVSTAYGFMETWGTMGNVVSAQTAMFVRCSLKPMG